MVKPILPISQVLELTFTALWLPPNNLDAIISLQSTLMHNMQHRGESVPPHEEPRQPDDSCAFSATTENERGSKSGIYLKPRLSQARQLTDEQHAPFNIEFLFTPKESHEEVPGKDWEAALQVQASDVSKLMRKGFFWESTNVEETKGLIVSSERPRSHDARGPSAAEAAYDLNGWPVARRYVLKDRAWFPRWKAELWFRGRELSTVSQFRIHKLSLANCHSAQAWSDSATADGLRSRVFYYDSEKPQDCYNVFYDDKLLGGWWPWPGKCHTEPSPPLESTLYYGTKKDESSPSWRLPRLSDHNADILVACILLTVAFLVVSSLSYMLMKRAEMGLIEWTIRIK